MHKHAEDYKHLHGYLLFLVVIVFLAVYLMLTFYNPELVQRKEHGEATGVNDVALTMLWALGITLAIVVVLALLFYAFACYH